jgi:hypothetical protein
MEEPLDLLAALDLDRMLAARRDLPFLATPISSGWQLEQG